MKGFGEYLRLAIGKEPNAIEKVDSAVNALGKNGFILVDEGSKIRKVNVKGLSDPKWGLTEQHLDKHFWGGEDYKIALNKLDPSGNMDKWRDHFVELLNSPVTSVDARGIMEVKKVFPKADGSGLFSMGVKLSENPDGTFDLITVLTDPKRGLLKGDL